MVTNLYKYFPTDISDEAAFHVVNFFMDLACALEEHYYGQIKRYSDENMPLAPPDFIQKKSNTPTDEDF